MSKMEEEQRDKFTSIFGDDSDEDDEDFEGEQDKKKLEGKDVDDTKDEDDDEDDKAIEAQAKKDKYKAIFGDDSDEEDDEDFNESAKVKSTLANLAKKAKKGKKAAQSKKQVSTKRQRDLENRKAQQAKKKAKISKDENDLWDLVDSENDEDGEATEADKKFIDDDDADNLDSSDDEGNISDAPQAEEGDEDDIDEIDAKLKLKSRSQRSKKQLNAEEKQHVCRRLITRMEAAFDNDTEAVRDNKPAMHKLRLLPDVDNLLSNRKMVEDLLDEGILNVLYSWLSPLPGGNLPNVKIRATLLRLLLAMNINPNDEHKRDKLKSSNIGKIVMFLYKVEDETKENKKMARDLVRIWSRPIFSLNAKANRNRMFDDLSQNKGGEAERSRSKPIANVAEMKDDILKQKNNAPDAAQPHRYRVRVPQPSNMDFKIQPASFDYEDKRKKAQKSNEKSLQVERKLRELSKKSKKFERNTHMSIEGRGMH